MKPGTGGRGASQSGPGTGGGGIGAGSSGFGGAGGQGNGEGGGGGGGFFGGGGGASGFPGPFGGGGGGGSALLNSSAHTVSGVRAGDGSASFYWLTASPSPAAAAARLTLTAHMPAAAAGGTQMFTVGAQPIPGCTAVAVAPDGRAVCATTLPTGSTDVTAKYSPPARAGATRAPTVCSVPYGCLSQTTTVTVTAATVTPPVSGGSAASPHAPGWPSLAAGLALVAGAASPAPRRRGRLARLRVRR